MRGSAICCELLITILETPEDGLAELHTPQPHCFKTAFPGSPNGFSSRPLRKTFARSSDLCVVQEEHTAHAPLTALAGDEDSKDQSRNHGSGFGTAARLAHAAVQRLRFPRLSLQRPILRKSTVRTISSVSRARGRVVRSSC